MRNKRWLVIPFLLFFLLGCGLISDVQNIKNAATTQLPAILTSAPTTQGMIETIAAQQSSSTCTGTPTAGGLGVSLDTARTVLQMTQQFAFTDGTANGQSAVIVTLTTSGASSFPAIAQGFSAQFIGDVCNLSRVSVTIPRSDQQDTVDQGIGLLNIVLAGTLPPDVQLTFLTWVAQNYSTVAVSGQQQTTIKNMQFTLQRNQTSMLLDIVPAP
jgi:hypothetical protein